MKIFKIFGFVLLGAIFAFGVAVWLGWPFPVFQTTKFSLSYSTIPSWKGVWGNVAVWFSGYGVWVVIARQIYKTAKRLVIISSILLVGILGVAGYFYYGVDRLSLLFGQ